MSISHWGMFFGYFVSVTSDGLGAGAGFAAWRPCSPEELARFGAW